MWSLEFIERIFCRLKLQSFGQTNCAGVLSATLQIPPFALLPLMGSVHRVAKLGTLQHSEQDIQSA